jgi:hypothetical protein
VGGSYDGVVVGVTPNEHNRDAISHHDSQRLWWTRECCGRLRAGRSPGGGDHSVSSGSRTVCCNELNVVAVDLIHILELPCNRTIGAQANSLFQPDTTGHHVRGIVPHMESQVPGACIREGYRNAGPYFISPPKHLVLTLRTWLTSGSRERRGRRSGCPKDRVQPLPEGRRQSRSPRAGRTDAAGPSCSILLRRYQP